MRLCIPAVLFCLAVMPTCSAATEARRQIIQDGFRHFSELCLDNFPSVEKMEESMRRLGWNRVSVPTESERRKPLFIESWMSGDAEFVLEVRNFAGRIWCTVGFHAVGELPIADLSSRYSLGEDRAASEKLSNASGKQNKFWIFSILIQGRTRNVVVMSGTEPLASGEFSHELTITDAPLF